MHPSFIFAVITAFASATHGEHQSVANTQITAAQYATIMASMSACNLPVDMSKAGQLMVASGIDPKTQEQAEAIGKMVWEESQRVFTMSNAEQTAHCQRMRQMVQALGL